jgi:hypothetical protein
MNSRLVLIGSLVAAALIAAACSTTTTASGPYGAASPAPSAAPSAAPIVAPSAPPAPPVASGTAINLASTRLGQVLVDSKGLAAGDETGQGVNAFGAPWYVVSPSGAQIG